jgi:hypothetical protein
LTELSAEQKDELIRALFACVVSLTAQVEQLPTDLPKGGLRLIGGLTRLELTFDFVTFWIVELIVFALILRARMLTDVMCLISTLTLLLVPYFKGDTANFVMRASMGPLFVLALRSVEMLAAWGLLGIAPSRIHHKSPQVSFSIYAAGGIFLSTSLFDHRLEFAMKRNPRGDFR